MQSWLEGRIWVGKGAQATGMTASLRIQSSRADSNTCESFTSSGLKLESVHQESPRSDVFRKRATKPLLNQRQRQKHLTWAVEKKNWTVAQWSKVLFSDESKFSFQGPRVWRKSGEAQNPCAWSPVWSFHSQWWFGLPCFLLVLVQCFLKSTVNAAIYQEIFRALHASFCWQALWRCWFHFPAGLGTCPHCQRYQKLVQWPWCYCAWLASKLAWPEPHRESMVYLWNHMVLSRGRWETPDPTMQMTWRPLSKKPGPPYHLSSATNWSPPCHAELRQ